MPYKVVLAPDGGLVSSKLDTTLINKITSPSMNNIKRIGDYFGQRDGRTAYGSVSGIVQHYYHLKVANTNRFIKFTSTGVYVKNTTGWTDITGSALTGTIDDFVDACTVYDDGSGTFYVVMTNNKDNMRKVPTSGNSADLSAWTSHKSKFVRYYKGYLVAAHITTGGTIYPVRFICSNTDNPNDLTGNSRTFNLTQDKNMSPIMRIEHFGNYLACYKTDCIYLLYLGSTQNIFEWDVAVHGIGLKASRALAVDGNGYHYFLGLDNVYRWTSPGAQPEPLGTDKIRLRIFELADPVAICRSWMVYHQEYNQIRLYIPESTYLSKVFVYDIEDKTWWEESTGTDLTAVGSFQEENSLTWSEATGTWTANAGTSWVNSGGGVQSNFKLVLEGDNAGASRYLDPTVNTDKNATISSEYQTGDRVYEETNDDGNPYNYKRVMGLRLEAKGDRVYLDYSLDEGETWTAITSGLDSTLTAWNTYTTLTSEWKWYEAHFDVVTDKIRFRFRNSTNNTTWYIRKFLEILEDGEDYFA